MNDTQHLAGSRFSPEQKERLLLACYLCSVFWTALCLLGAGVHAIYVLLHVPVLSQLLLLLGASASIYLYVTMLMHCIRSPRPLSIKVIWILLFLATLHLGAICYYVAVYKRDKTAQKEAVGVSPAE
jgi:hypothetical protein